jgi:lipopolysaccharide biosynthesis glycosyltransferase
MHRPDIDLTIVKNVPFNININVHHKSVPSKMVYFKYLLWTDKFNEYDNILHLDVDTIVLSPLDDIIGCPEFFIVRNNISFKEIQILSKNKAYKDTVEDTLKSYNLRCPDQDDMVNAGVFVIPKRYRKKRYLDSLINITNDFNTLLVYADQSALSLWCLKNHINPNSDYRYNFQMPLFNKFFQPRYKKWLGVGNYFSLKKDILNRIKIVHYSGPIKPDCSKFINWILMGRYAGIFINVYNKYNGVPR